MITPRLRRLEKTIHELANATCTACWDGLGVPFITQHWLREDGTAWEETFVHETYDAQGRCRRCGRECQGRITLQLPECVREARVARGESANGHLEGASV